MLKLFIILSQPVKGCLKAVGGGGRKHMPFALSKWKRRDTDCFMLS